MISILDGKIPDPEMSNRMSLGIDQSRDLEHFMFTPIKFASGWSKQDVKVSRFGSKSIPISSTVIVANPKPTGSN